tara:strand:- start:303 stop:653 length:351 start_codon:yes stop_codon:yes gene_type:complete
VWIVILVLSAMQLPLPESLSLSKDGGGTSLNRQTFKSIHIIVVQAMAPVLEAMPRKEDVLLVTMIAQILMMFMVTSMEKVHSVQLALKITYAEAKFVSLVKTLQQTVVGSVKKWFG